MKYRLADRIYQSWILSHHPTPSATEPLQRHLLRRRDRRVVIGHQSNSRRIRTAQRNCIPDVEQSQRANSQEAAGAENEVGCRDGVALCVHRS